MELISYLWQYLVEAFGLIIAYGFAGIFIVMVLRRIHSWKVTAVLAIVFIGVSIAFYIPNGCLLYTSPSPRDRQKSRMPSSEYTTVAGTSVGLRAILSTRSKLSKFWKK